MPIRKHLGDQRATVCIMDHTTAIAATDLITTVTATGMGTGEAGQEVRAVGEGAEGEVVWLYRQTFQN